MRKYSSLGILLLFISHNLLAQGIDENNPTATENYLIQVNDNISERGQIYKITPDSILIKFEFLGNVSISRESNLTVEVKGGSLFNCELLEISNNSLLIRVSGYSDIWIENNNIIKFWIIEQFETNNLKIKNPLITSVDFKIGSLSHATVNIEKVRNINMNVATLTNFGPSYIYTPISPDGYLAEAHGPGIHLSFTRLGGQKPYRYRDTHFEISGGIYLGMLLYGFTNTQLGGLYIYPKTNIGYRYQSPSSDTIFRIYVGFLTVGLSIGSK